MKTHFHSAALCIIGRIWHHWHTLTGKVYGKVFALPFLADSKLVRDDAERRPEVANVRVVCEIFPPKLFPTSGGPP
jgi:hypothetical protein